jgi:hypothetical protein
VHVAKFRVVAASLLPQRVLVVFFAHLAFSHFERNIYIQRRARCWFTYTVTGTWLVHAYNDGRVFGLYIGTCSWLVYVHRHGYVAGLYTQACVRGWFIEIVMGKVLVCI